MKVPIRTTANGTEYWDSEAKKILFVPAGEKPAFEVTESPESMIIGIDLSNGKDTTVINGQVVEPLFNLDGMTATQLREYAEENNIEVPGNLKKPDTIREYIEEQLAVDED
ncbi:hypothetical protein [Lysinibacillus sp. FW12]|uniref:hypothetical protein n=1 Tax=Lysinibacillus sp. FW12 TaxID=3096079 RepID=UPI003D75FA5A